MTALLGRQALRSRWIVAFGVVAVAHLVLLAAGAAPWDSITKCLLAPLVAAWVIERGGPRLLVAALGLCLLGDLFLEIEPLFVLGMAAFATAHGCFIVLFVRRGALGRLRVRPWAALLYLAAGVGLVAWAWGGLEADVRPFVPVYALLLVGTAATSLAVDRTAGLGGVLFLVSDGFIALGEAGRVDADALWHGLVVMSLYALGIALLAAGVVDTDSSRSTTTGRVGDESLA